MDEERKSRGLSFWFKTINSEELALKTIKWGSLIFLVFFVIICSLLSFIAYAMTFYGGPNYVTFIFILIILSTPVVLSILLKKQKSKTIAIMFLLFFSVNFIEKIIGINNIVKSLIINGLLSFILATIMLFVSIRVVKATFYYSKLKK